ncbi:hypothetical protein ACFX1R_032272 [Malus domestica]
MYVCRNIFESLIPSCFSRTCCPFPKLVAGLGHGRGPSLSETFGSLIFELTWMGLSQLCFRKSQQLRKTAFDPSTPSVRRCLPPLLLLPVEAAGLREVSCWSPFR